MSSGSGTLCRRRLIVRFADLHVFCCGSGFSQMTLVRILISPRNYYSAHRGKSGLNRSFCDNNSITDLNLDPGGRPIFRIHAVRIQNTAGLSGLALSCAPYSWPDSLSGLLRLPCDKARSGGGGSPVGKNWCHVYEI
jgi:hypothetical protein